MVFESISNFDMYIWIAIGLFIVGLLSTMAYEKSNIKSKSSKQT